MPAPRLHVDQPLAPGMELGLGANGTRHVQVLRLQPGAPLTLFDGRGGEWSGEVSRIGRREVSVRVGAHRAIERELACRVTLALGMPANERMDSLIEKATELGVDTIQPLVCRRSVLRVEGERGERKAAHWHAVAAAACEQCGRNRLPTIAPPLGFAEWLLRAADEPAQRRWLLSLASDARPLVSVAAAGPRIGVLSGPEGGLSDDELAAALHAGWSPVSLGARVLRADTAPLAALAWIALSEAA
jgi:16S rRNA (uracil1498-N3)-methyltransferase